MSDNMEIKMTEPVDDIIKDLEPIKDTPIAPAHGIAAIALNMALKYHDINTVQDGVLYQQYKMEGKNIHGLHLDHVFDTAMKMEMFLLGASERIAKVVFDAISAPDSDEQPEDESELPEEPDENAEPAS